MPRITSRDIETKRKFDAYRDIHCFNGTICGKHVSILKDDGCNTNVISKDLVRLNKDLFEVRPVNTDVSHSNLDDVDRATGVLKDVEINIEGYLYISNWIIANCRYDVLLKMPWHKQEKAKINNEDMTVDVKGTLFHPEMKYSSMPTVTNMSIKKVKSMVQKHKQK